MHIQFGILILITAFFAGCDSPTTSEVASGDPPKQQSATSKPNLDTRKSGSVASVTFYLAGMNGKLKIL
jgi:hypothetical protein